MSLALVALLLLVAILVLAAVRSDLNAGVFAVAVAYGLGLWVMGLSAAEVAAFLPSQLVLTIVGVALLFEMAHQNGTLERLTALMIRLVRGNTRLLPMSFFLLTFALSAMGPGNIAATALVAPVAMPTAVAAGLSPFLMAVLVCTGANAGAFSPVSVTGNINATLIQKIGLTDPLLPLQIFVIVALIQSVTAVAAYWLLGGYRFKRSPQLPETPPPRFERRHLLTLAAVGVFILALVAFRAPAPAVAFALIACLSLLRIADADASIKALPWGVLLLISGLSILIGLLEEVGSLELTTRLLAQAATPQTLNATLAFFAGLASVGSSSSGVVMPLFIPLAPQILERLGGGDLAAAVMAIDLGSHMVDVSPLSTLGALCLAALPSGVNRSRLFRNLLLWGLAMTFVAALLAWVFLDLI
ncbi:MAG: SLC13 family permease [Meiothermus sp.]|nr:SLC13 family permease [Meiothermus sp.]